MSKRNPVVAVLISLLLAGCAQPAYNPTPTPSIEDMPPPVAEFSFQSPEGSPTTERPPSMYLNPSMLALEVGQTASVEVWAEGMEGVHTISLEMHFDPLFVQVEDADPNGEGIQVTAGDLMGLVLENRVEDADPNGEGIQVTAGDLMGLVLENRVENGRLVYRAAVPPEGATRASGVLLSIALRGVSPGTTPLQFENVAGQDAAGSTVEVSALSDGLITVSGIAAEPTEEVPPPVAEASPVAAPTPWVATPMPSVTGGIYYVVGPGENLFRIGLEFGTTAEAIAAASNIPDPRRVAAGTMVLVPVPPPGGGYGYYVRPGDTVYSIARRFGMTVEELAALNNIGPDFAIRAGTILKVTPRR